MPSSEEPSRLSAFIESLILCRRPVRPSEWIPSRPSPLDQGPDRAPLLSRAYFQWASPLVSRAAATWVPVQLEDLFLPPREQSAAVAGAEVQAAWAAELACAAAAASAAHAASAVSAESGGNATPHTQARRCCARGHSQQPSLAWALWVVVRRDLAVTSLFKLGWLLFAMLSNSLLLQQLVAFLQPSSTAPAYWGYVLSALFFAVECARSLAVNTHWFVAVSAGTRLRAGVRALLYAKALRLRSGGGASVGLAANLINNDASRCLEACSYAEFIVSAPVTLTVCLAVLWNVLGPSALAGFAVLLLFTPLQARLGRIVGGLRARTIRITDERAKLMSEVISGIKLVKLYSWEGAFAARVADVRVREIAMLRRAALYRVLNSIVAFSVAPLVTLCTFAAFVFWTGQPLDAGAAYVAVSLFNVARFPLAILPLAVKNVSEAAVAARRIQAFLALPEVDPNDTPAHARGAAAAAEEAADLQRVTSDGAGTALEALRPAPGVLLEARAASFAWPVESGATGGGGPPRTAASEGPPTAPHAISDVSFQLRCGEVLAVVGPVACGKSSLLSSLLGQLTRLHGGFILQAPSSRAAGPCRLAYAAQSPWVFSGSLRENIVFGRPLDAQRYAEVLEACQLGADIAQMPAGDATEIGEKGLNLSGGQKARVALARAVYADADLYLLDDPLSAVDVHVGRALFERVIGPAGLLAGRGKGVLLVTHQTQYLHACSGVLIMEQGRIVAAGSHTQLVASGHFAAAAGAPEPAESAMEPSTAAAAPIALSPVVPGVPLSPIKSLAPAPQLGALVVAEDRSIGSLDSSTITAYLKAAGGARAASSSGALIGLLLLLMLIVCKGSISVSNWYLTWWTQHRGESPETYFLGWYAVTAAGVLLLTLLQGVSFAIVTLRASRHLHDAAFVALLRAAPWWFDTQPTGRLLARFTGDLDAIDTSLPASLEQSSEYLVQCGLAIVLIAAVFPWFLVALIPILTCFLAIASLFRRAARELKRIDSLARSPLVSHVSATLGGLVTIRSCGASGLYLARAQVAIDDSTKAGFAFYLSNRWIAIRLDFATAVVAATAALLCTLTRGAIAPGLGGLVLTNALQLAGILQYATRLTSECESQLTSVERLAHYADPQAVPREHLAVLRAPRGAAAKAAAMALAEAGAGEPEEEAAPLLGLDDPRAVNALLPEAQLARALRGAAARGRGAPPAARLRGLPAAAAPAAARFFPGWYPASWHPGLLAARWPAAGGLVFRELSLRYRPGLPLVLRRLSFAVRPGARLGIVGRTGSGKSTLLLGLLRYLEAAGGAIAIDGVDIAAVNVHHVRSVCAVIPQDPVLYSGTLRSNVDPWGAASDEEVERALREAGAGELAGAGEPAGAAPPAAAGAPAAAPAPASRALARAISAGGANLSVGERQLVCLARAFLRDAPIICLDEATASTDAHTDALVQRAIRACVVGAGKTVLCIAHRLHTIMEYDAVLVLERGAVGEFDDPAVLLGLRPASTTAAAAAEGRTGPRGLLAAMVQETGPETAAALVTMARAAAEARERAGS